jgi:hypothetical protein
MSAHGVALIGITLLAATVNGALGYGFSSITVPLALLFLTNRVLNPALVLIEVPLNAYVLFVNRADVPAVWKRVLPLVIGVVPGVVLGTLIVSRVNPSWVRLYTFAVLLPLILVQAAGYRRPIRAEKTGGLLFGAGLGVLYSVTTISGPPLALALSNQGLAKREFRAALALVRLAESTLTAVAYLSTGMITGQSLGFVPFIVPSVAIGVPLGGWIIRHVRPEAFRRVCMSFDAWIVAFGVSILLRQLHLVPDVVAFAVLATVGAADGCLLYRFFFPASTARRTTMVRPNSSHAGSWHGPLGATEIRQLDTF